jgi:hypothetical protein
VKIAPGFHRKCMDSFAMAPAMAGEVGLIFGQDLTPKATPYTEGMNDFQSFCAQAVLCGNEAPQGSRLLVAASCLKHALLTITFRCFIYEGSLNGTLRGACIVFRLLCEGADEVWGAVGSGVMVIEVCRSSFDKVLRYAKTPWPQNPEFCLHNGEEMMRNIVPEKWCGAFSRA